MAGYVAAKRAAFSRQTSNDLAIVGVDDPWCRELASELGATTISGWQPADTWCDGVVLRDAAGPLLDLRAAPALPGIHNFQNAAAAAAAALRLGVSRAQVADGIASFAGLPHRQQRVTERAGVTYVDDSKATNADAASRALACYDRVVWIAGGIAKDGGIEALRPLLPRVAHAVLIGRDAPLLARTLADAGVPHSLAGTLDHAVPEAARLAAQLDASVVLLSPACASFDQFTGFEARGARFAALARALPGGAADLNAGMDGEAA